MRWLLLCFFLVLCQLADCTEHDNKKTEKGTKPRKDRELQDLPDRKSIRGDCKQSSLLRDVSGGSAGVAKSICGHSTPITRTEAPSNAQSNAPSPLPTDQPSPPPSAPPITDVPTAPPVTNSPTSSFVEPNRVPDDPPPGYFNYDLNDMEYGPRQWHRIDASNHPLREFGPNGSGPWRGHLDYDPSDNKCGARDRKQSPKDMKPTVECDAFHEIRTSCGTYGLSSDAYERQILPHKLSLVMNRRPCIEMDKNICKRLDPPKADYPRYSSSLTSFADMINYDIKIPGEHTIDGETFDAEIQMLHTFPTASRVSSIGVLVRARENGHNSEFQGIINEFQSVYDDHTRACSMRRRRTRGDKWDGMHSTPFEDSDREHLSHNSTRYLRNGRFDPYALALMPTIFFYRYDGSITEPPCKDITWWVMTDPVIISNEQLNQIKRILFTHVDEDCNPTSVHNADQSVARPIYPLGDNREIQDCARGAFISDFEKHGTNARNCK